MPAHFGSGEMSHFAALFQDLPLKTTFPHKEKEATWFKDPTTWGEEPTLPHKEATWFKEFSLRHKEPSAFRPRISEEPKLPGLSLLPLKTPLIPSGLEEPAAPGCRNVKRVDSHTVIPGFVFDGMMKLGKEARKRGAHEWTRRPGTRGVLRIATTDSKKRSSI